MANAYLYYIQKGIHFPSDDYSGTPAVLFIWLKAQMICIDSLFIHCWTRHCIYECRQNGPNYGERCLPVTPQQSKMMKVSNWEEKSNQRPLVVFCKFGNQNGKHFLLWLTMVHLGLQIRLVTRKHESGLPNFLTLELLQCPSQNPGLTLFPGMIYQCIFINVFCFYLLKCSSICCFHCKKKKIKKLLLFCVSCHCKLNTIELPSLSS